MKKFLVLYYAPVSAAEQMAKATPAEAKAGMDAWMAWGAKAGPAIADMGMPLGPAVAIGKKPGEGHLGGFSILQAKSVSALQHVLDGHPHLGQPGCWIEAHEFLPLPGM